MSAALDTADEPFSVWNFNAQRVESGVIVKWKEELEAGTRDVCIVVRSQDEFDKAIDRFTIAVRKTWDVWLRP